MATTPLTNVSLTVNDTQIKALGSAPQTLVAAIPGKTHIPVTVAVERPAFAAGYTANAGFNIAYANSTTTPALAFTPQIFTPTNPWSGLVGITTVLFPTAGKNNIGVVIVNPTGDISGGNVNNTLTVTLAYFTIDSVL